MESVHELTGWIALLFLIFTGGSGFFLLRRSKFFKLSKNIHRLSFGLFYPFSVLHISTAEEVNLYQVAGMVMISSAPLWIYLLYLLNLKRGRWILISFKTLSIILGSAVLVYGHQVLESHEELKSVDISIQNLNVKGDNYEKYNDHYEHEEEED